jgi:putative ABC transport system substrate-binding protein
MNNRRKLVIALGAGALAAPFGSFAQQQGKVWRVGYLFAGPKPTAGQTDKLLDAFVRGLRDLGYTEGKNLLVEWRFAEGSIEVLPSLAAELVALKVDVVVTNGTPAVRAALGATRTIPIVSASFADPVGSGFAASLSHPGGNITGLANLGEEINGKRLELLRQLVPKARKIAWLVNPDNPATVRMVPGLQASARKAGMEIIQVNTRNLQAMGEAIAQMKQKNFQAVIVADDGVLNRYQEKIAQLALQHKLPAIFAARQAVESGGLINYGVDQTDTYRRAAGFVDKILKGAKAGDIPIEQPTKFELFINGKTAKALGLKIPQSLLIMADKVIE